MRKLCSVHWTGTDVVISLQHELPGSELRLLMPMAKLSTFNLTIESLGQAMMCVLSSPGILKEKLDFKAATKAMVEFAGFKSWRAFADATESYCSVETADGQAKIRESFRDGAGFGSSYGDGGKCVTCKLTADSLGRSLFDVLGLA